MPGPPRWGHAHGHPVRYDTVQPCTHPWWHDDTGYDPHTDQLITRAEYLARLAARNDPELTLWQTLGTRWRRTHGSMITPWH